jgi:hypothetical protein
MSLVGRHNYLPKSLPNKVAGNFVERLDKLRCELRWSVRRGCPRPSYEFGREIKTVTSPCDLFFRRNSQSAAGRLAIEVGDRAVPKSASCWTSLKEGRKYMSTLVNIDH